MSRTARSQGPSFIGSVDYDIVEFSGSGHRLWYVALLLERAIQRGLTFRLTVTPQAFNSSGWTEFIAPILDRTPFEVNVSSRSRREILNQTRVEGVQVVIPDGDRWIGALLASSWPGRPLAANVLIMRPFPDRTVKSRVKQLSKRFLLFMASQTHRRLSVYHLVAVPGKGAGREIPDPVVLQASAQGRDEWIHAHELDPSLSWLVVLGELSNRKHLPEIIEAFASQRLQKSSWGVVAVGTMPGELQTVLMRTVDQHPQRIAIRNGFVSGEDFDSWITHADAVAVLHRNEGSSGVLLKCWAAGTAVLAGGAQSVVSAAHDLRLEGTRISLVTPETIAEAVVLIDATTPAAVPAPAPDALVRRNRQFVDALLSR